MQGGDTVAIKEIAKEIVQDFDDTPLPLVWQTAWARCRTQLAVIAYLAGFITAAMFRETVQTVLTFVAFVALVVLVRKTYQAAKKVLIEEEQKGGEKA